MILRKLFYFIEISILMIILLGCSKNIRDVKLVFNNSPFIVNDEGKIKITGELKNGETGILKANLNTKNINLKVNKNGKFQFYYDLKNIHDNKIYLGIESNGVIVGNETNIIIPEKIREESLLSAGDIIKRYNHEGLVVLNPTKITIQDLSDMGLNSANIDFLTAEKFTLLTESGNLANVKIFTFNSFDKLSVAYEKVVLNSIVPFPKLKVFNKNININKNISKDNVPPSVLQNYNLYIKNRDKIPLLNSWIYKTYIEDSGYVLIIQDSTINSSIASSHEKIINDLLLENRIDENDME